MIFSLILKHHCIPDILCSIVVFKNTLMYNLQIFFLNSFHLRSLMRLPCSFFVIIFFITCTSIEFPCALVYIYFFCDFPLFLSLLPSYSLHPSLSKAFAIAPHPGLLSNQIFNRGSWSCSIVILEYPRSTPPTSDIWLTYSL